MHSEHDEPWDSESWDPDPFDPLNHEEWDEEDWAAYFDHQDVLLAKYDELMETLGHHPDRDDLVAAEMHWNLPDEIGFPCDGACGDPGSDGGDEAPTCEHMAELDSIPALRAAEAFVLAVEEEVDICLGEPENDEDALVAMEAAVAVVDRLVGGHQIGYERETLCGNIVCCRRAVASLTECVDSLLALRQRRVLPAAVVDALLVEGQQVGDAIAERIRDLRSRVWWQ
jgi:hypothetical protein